MIYLLQLAILYSCNTAKTFTTEKALSAANADDAEAVIHLVYVQTEKNMSSRIVVVPSRRWCIALCSTSQT